MKGTLELASSDVQWGHTERNDLTSRLKTVGVTNTSGNVLEYFRSASNSMVVKPT